MKKMISISVVVLFMIACGIIWLQLQVSKEWQSGMYMKDISAYITSYKGEFSFELPVIVVGKDMADMLIDGECEVKLTSGSKEMNAIGRGLYHLDQKHYTVCVVRISGESFAESNKYNHIIIQKDENILMEKDINLTINTIENLKDDRLALQETIFTEKDNGYEAKYFISNSSDQDITLREISWQSALSETFHVTYVNDLKKDTETVDLLNEKEFNGPIVIKAGMAVLICVDAAASTASEPTWLYGTPEFKYEVGNDKISAVAEVSCIPNISLPTAEEVLKMIKKK